MYLPDFHWVFSMSEEPVANPLPTPPAGAFTASAPPTSPLPPQQTAEEMKASLEASQRAETLKRLAALRQAKLFRGLEWAMVPLVLALAFMLGSFAVHNSDYWMHLATGRLIAHGDYIIGHDPFSFGTEGRYWVNHSWIYDLLLYEIWKIDSTGAVAVVLKAILLTLMAGFMLLSCQPDPQSRIPLGSRANPTGWLAALLVAAALIAAAPRLLLQPTVISFLFVAITFWLLMRNLSRPASWRLPAALAMMFVLWVNLDAWFFLGPALVGLFFIGALVQQVLPGEKPAGPAQLKMLGLSLVIGVLACLLNPHTWHAFTLPADLYPSQLPEAFRTDASFRYQFYSPFDHRFYSNEALGKSYSGWCYFALLALGVLSFGLNSGRLRWPIVLTWLGMAGLSTLNARAIPFFTVVAAPIAVWNFHAAIARWTLRPNDQLKGEVAPAMSEPPGGVNVTPEAVLSFLGLTGRLLTLALGVAVVILAWPGWLTPVVPSWQDRRVAWRAEPDEGLKLAAEQIQRWREEGRLPESAHGFQSHPDLVNYAAWFAPKEKGFFDYRYSFLSDRAGDFVDVRRTLREIALDGKSESPVLSEVFRKYGIRYVVFSRHDPVVMPALLHYLYLHPDEWAIWNVNGYVMIAGWRDKESQATPKDSQDNLSNLKENFVHNAFGPQTARIPLPTKGQIAGDPDTPIPARTSWDNFLSAPDQVPLEAEQSNLYWLLENTATDVGVSRALLVNEVAQRVAEIGIHATPEWRALPATLPAEAWRRGQIPDLARIQVWYRDDEVPALAVLATRAARKGIALHPDDPISYFNLASAYDDFARGSQSQLLILAKIAALRQGLARLTPELAKDNWVIGQVHNAYPLLIRLYYSSRHVDLAVECMKKNIDFLRHAPPSNRSDEEFEQILKFLQQQLQQMQRELERNSGLYEADAQGQPVHIKIALAERYGLTKELMRLLEDEAGKKQLTPTDALRLVETYLQLGQVEQAWSVLGEVEEKVGVEQLDPRSQRFYQILRINVATIRGDFPEAIKYMDRFIAEQEQIGNQLQWTGKMGTGKMVSIIGAHLLDLMVQNPFLRFHLIKETNQMLREALAYYEQTASGYFGRALLSLEYGDNESARKYFALAVRQGVPFEGRREAQRYLELLQKELPESAPNRETTPSP